MVLPFQLMVTTALIKSVLKRSISMRKQKYAILVEMDATAATLAHEITL
jgi:hypothetical protein